MSKNSYKLWGWGLVVLPLGAPQPHFYSGLHKQSSVLSTVTKYGQESMPSFCIHKSSATSVFLLSPVLPNLASRRLNIWLAQKRSLTRAGSSSGLRQRIRSITSFESFDVTWPRWLVWVCSYALTWSTSSSAFPTNAFENKAFACFICVWAETNFTTMMTAIALFCGWVLLSSGKNSIVSSWNITQFVWKKQ